MSIGLLQGRWHGVRVIGMLFHREHSETVRVVVKTVRPRNRPEFRIETEFAKCFGVTENDPQIIRFILVEVNGCAIAIRECQRDNEWRLRIYFRFDDTLWPPCSCNLKFLRGTRCIHTMLLSVTDAVRWLSPLRTVPVYGQICSMSTCPLSDTPPGYRWENTLE